MFLFVLCSCITLKPKDFTYYYNKEYSGLDTLIDINGYYLFQRECDSTFHSVLMFYPDGLFTIATGTDLTEVVRCFQDEDMKSVVCDYPLWGVYKIEGNTIKTQAVRQEGIEMFTIFRDYKILPDEKLVNLNEYVYSENTKIGYLKNYPSFMENKCPVFATFYPLETKRSSSKCPYINKKWFKEKK